MVSRGNVLITGTSTGIGKATVLHLDQLGFRVFACVRKASDGEALCALASERLTPICLDLTNAQTIADAKDQVSRAVGGAGLAGLVNNAGDGFGLPLEFTPLDALRALFEVNVFGLLALTQDLLPLVREAHGRIVNISSTAAIMVVPFHGPYSATKFCVNAFSDALRQELKPFGVQVSVVVTGNIATPLWEKGNRRGQELRAGLPPLFEELYGNAYNKFIEYFLDMGQHGIPPDAVAQTIAQALTAKHAKPYYTVGRGARALTLLKRVLPVRLQDQMILRAIGIQN